MEIPLPHTHMGRVFTGMSFSSVISQKEEGGLCLGRGTGVGCGEHKEPDPEQGSSKPAALP